LLNAKYKFRGRWIILCSDWFDEGGGGTVGRGAGLSRVRFPTVSLEFFIVIIFPWGSTLLLTEMSTRNIYLGVKTAGA
jgi:hypothetical protein